MECVCQCLHRVAPTAWVVPAWELIKQQQQQQSDNNNNTDTWSKASPATRTEFRISLSQDLIEQNKPQNVVRLIHFCIKLYIILTLFTECRRMKASQKIDQLYIFYNVQVKIKFIEINKLLNCCVNETSMHNIMNEILSKIKQVTPSCND